MSEHPHAPPHKRPSATGWTWECPCGLVFQGGTKKAAHTGWREHYDERRHEFRRAQREGRIGPDSGGSPGVDVREPTPLHKMRGPA